jgi:O-succinylbenzoic acid--CoA ligase
MRASADATHARLGGPGQWVLNLLPAYVAGLQVLFRSVRAGTTPVASADALTGGRRYLSLVPTQLTRMLDVAADLEWLRGLDTVLVGGARLDPALRGRAEDAGVRVVATYGMSETCGGCVYDGVPLDGVEVDLAPDGRVRLGGPVLFDGYDGRPDLTAQVLRDGRFVTADLGRLVDGRLQVLGRVDDVVVSGGVNVATGAVAGRLREPPTVHGAEVVGVPDDEWGRAVVAVVVADGLTLAAARDWVAGTLPRTWAPRRLVPVDTLPLLANGKTDRLAVERLAHG